MAERKILTREITRIIREQFDQKKLSLDRIVLFGSYARGKQGPESDIDLIIVSKEFRGKNLFDRVRLATGINRELVYQTGEPFDLLYYSDLEWRKGASFIINEAKREGKVIYG